MTERSPRLPPDFLGREFAGPGRYGHHRSCTRIDCNGCDTITVTAAVRPPRRPRPIGPRRPTLIEEIEADPQRRPLLDAARAERAASVHCCCGMDPDPDTRQRCLRAGHDLGFTTDHCPAPGPECQGCPRSPQSPDGEPCTDCGAAPGACNCETYRRRRYGAQWEEET